MNISYAITVCNEYIEIQNLLTHLLQYVDLKNNEIIILADNTKLDDRVDRLCEDHYNYGNVKRYHKDAFSGHFSEWKNKFKNLCSKDYIFQIDADEIPNEFLLNHLNEILEQNSSIELFWVPRENYVDGLTQEHINKWNWKVDSSNRINFPDYQARLFKNLPHIYWQNKVHEIVVGCVAQASLPAESRFCLLHQKNIHKQEQQNAYYDTLS